MDFELKILKTNRNNIANFTKGLNLERINKVPVGLKNSIGWTVAHLVVTQQLLCYKLSDRKLLIPNYLVEKFSKGTFPKEDLQEKEFKEIMTLFLELPNQLEKDYKKGLFTSFKPYATSTGIELLSIGDAIKFNNYHEGIHLGIILQLLKMV